MTSRHRIVSADQHMPFLKQANKNDATFMPRTCTRKQITKRQNENEAQL